MADEQTPQPPAKQTVSLPAMTDRALLEDQARTTRAILVKLSSVEITVDGLVGDHRTLHERVGTIERRLDRVENPSIIPPRPITSERVREVIEGHPSQMDLETAAKQAEEIAKGMERDRRIAETHELASLAATKADVADLAAGTATKEEVATLLADAAKTQTTDIVKSVTTLAEKSATVRMLLLALAGLLFVMINAATTYFTTKASAPPPVQPTQAVTVPK